jgi:polyferredoxin
MADSASLVVGSVFMLLAMAAVALLARKGRLGGRWHLAIMVVAVLLGFLIFAPVLPFQFMSLVAGGPQAPPAVAAVLIVAVLVIAFLMGRLYCGAACPIGAFQEILYLLPVKKLRYDDRRVLFAARAVILVAMIAAALVWHQNPLTYLGVRSAFSLQLTWTTLVFAAILAIGILWYRPFCRVLCPYGALMTLCSSKWMLGLRRNSKCTSCKACEKACPTGESMRASSGRDCYMCGRCTERCKFNAIDYSTKEEKE